MTDLFPPHLHIGVYRVTLVALEPVALADFSAATLRGAFGWSFKRMVCYQPQVKSCQGCLLRGQCPYPQVFEPPPPAGTIYAGQQQTVAPYVLRRPLAGTSTGSQGQQQYAPGSEIHFELVLLGWANGLLPYFALALQQLEERGLGRGRGRVAVAAIDLLPPHTQMEATGAENAAPIRLFDAQQPEQIDSHGGWPATAWLREIPAPSQITIQFASPTRLQSSGHVQGEPDFHVLYRALLRRVSALCTVHTDTPWETDFSGLATAAREVETVAASMKLERRQRHSDRQGAMEFWGAEGIMVYGGDLTLFWPLLQLGTVIHVGKNCTFGLGRYLLL